MPGSPAAQAGLQPSDVITKVDDIAVNDEQGLNFRVTTKGIGNTAAVTFIRGGQARTANVRLIAAPGGQSRAQTVIDGRNPLQGVTVANLSPALAQDLDLEQTKGVVITDVSGRGVAARFGFAPGDIIVGVNGRNITTVSTLQDALKRGGRAWNIAVNRNGSTMTLSVRN